MSTPSLPTALAPPGPDSPSASGGYHLGDGLMLSVGNQEGVLLNLADHSKSTLQPSFIAPLAEAAGGSDLLAYQALVPQLLDSGALVVGPAVMDPIIRDRLVALDRLFLPAYEASLGERARAAYQATLAAHAHRKRVQSRFVQCPVLPETALRRALLVGDAQQVGARRVVCIGDDDFVSMALAALGHDVTVYDIDDYLLDVLRRTAAELGLRVQVEKRDLLEPLPLAAQGQFDVFLTDPVSNRDCFLVFVSRALALVRPGGRGFVAVNGRAARQFRTLAAEQRLPIVAWHARHNRYYAPNLRLHTYESDLVEVDRAPDTLLAFAADEPMPPLDLYIDDIDWRPAMCLAFFDAIEGASHTGSFFLDTLVDVAEKHAPLSLYARHRHVTRAWSVLHGATRGGHLTVHVDRERHQIMWALSPMEVQAADALRQVIMSCHKSSASQASLSVGAGVWDLRVK